MSQIFNYDAPKAAQIYDKERYPVGADVIAGLLHVHCGKLLKDLHVLDAGCGTGHYTKALIDLGVGKFTLYDNSSAMLDVAKEKLKQHIGNNTIDDIVQAELPNLPFQDEMFDAILFLQDLRVLDAGCGTGHYTKALIDLGGGKFTILDVSSAMLNVAKENLKPYIDNKIVDEVIQAKLPSLPFANGTFDAAMFLGVFNHFDKSDYIKTLQAAKATLKPSGLVLMSTCLPLIIRDATWLGKLHQTHTEELCSRFMTTKQHLSLFAEQGFQCVAAMNFLNGATPSVYVNYFDHEGPLKEEWRLGTNMFEVVGSEVIQDIEKKCIGVKHQGLLRQFMTDNDCTDQKGFSTLLAFSLAEKFDHGLRSCHN